jgi:hypothetical protein
LPYPALVFRLRSAEYSTLPADTDAGIRCEKFNREAEEELEELELELRLLFAGSGKQQRVGLPGRR